MLSLSDIILKIDIEVVLTTVYICTTEVKEYLLCQKALLYWPNVLFCL